MRESCRKRNENQFSCCNFGWDWFSDYACMEKLEHVFMNRAVFSVSLSDVLKNSASRFSAISMASLAATFLRGTRQHYYESYNYSITEQCLFFLLVLVWLRSKKICRRYEQTYEGEKSAADKPIVYIGDITHRHGIYTTSFFSSGVFCFTLTSNCFRVF